MIKKQARHIFFISLNLSIYKFNVLNCNNYLLLSQAFFAIKSNFYIFLMFVDSFFVTAPTGNSMNNPMIRLLIIEGLFYSNKKGPIISNPLITFDWSIPY